MYEKRTAFPITAKHLSLPRTISHLLCPGRIKQRDSRTLRESRRKTVGAAALIGAGSGWGPIAGILPKGELCPGSGSSAFSRAPRFQRRAPRSAPIFPSASPSGAGERLDPIRLPKETLPREPPGASRRGRRTQTVLSFPPHRVHDTCPGHGASPPPGRA